MTIYVLWQFAGPVPSQVSEPQEFECLKAGSEALIADVHPDSSHLQDLPKDKGKELLALIF